ncbi:MAG: YraN family protein [Candidatus Limnocylindria bacterium]
MGDPRHSLGLRAEEAVAAWLSGSGWRVLARRWRGSAGGELDLICLAADRTLVGIEVRARRTDRAGSAAESVDRRRVLRLRTALAAYAAGATVPHHGLRIDLVAVSPAAGAQPGQWHLRRLAGVDAW